MTKAFPLFEELKKFGKKMFPDLPTKCPVKAGGYKFNYTHTPLNNAFSYIVKTFITSSMLPNGEYKHSGRLYNEKFGDLSKGYLKVTQYERLNEENFK